MTMTIGHDRLNFMTKGCSLLLVRIRVPFHDYLYQKMLSTVGNKSQSRPARFKKSFTTLKMITNMAANWKKGLLILGLTAVVLATPVMGIEVRHGCKSWIVKSSPLSFLACSLAFDLVAIEAEFRAYPPLMARFCSIMRSERLYSHIFSMVYFTRLSRTMPTVWTPVIGLSVWIHIWRYERRFADLHV